MNIKYLIGVVVLIGVIGCQLVDVSNEADDVMSITGAVVVEAEEVGEVVPEVISEEFEEVVDEVEVEPEVEDIVISMDGGSFEPMEVVIPVGTTVTWLNNDRRAHTIMDRSRTFRSERLKPMESFTFTFTEAGTYDYQDVVFYTVKGKIVVEN